jgi:hypothetical protein
MSNGIMDTVMTRRQMLGLSAVVGAGAMLALSGCSTSDTAGSSSAAQDTSGQSSAPAVTPSPENILVAYFSGTGHTRRVAERLADDLDATLFEIVPEDPYTEDDLNFNDENSRVSRQHDGTLDRDTPLAQTAPDDFDTYGTILLGYPIWWSEAAWAMDRFASDNNFEGRRVITFCTSQSSGLGSTTSTLADMAGTGDWENGRRFAEDADDATIDAWAEEVRASIEA